MECKTGYENTSIDKHLKYNKSDPLKNSWEQCINDATKTDRHPMLIFRKKGNNP
ncbi:MAG: putative PDDEXK endonuclease [Elusimicrobiota bacterium]